LVFSDYFGSWLGEAGINLASWQLTGQDKDSLNVDPLFMNAGAGDFRLKPGSPAYGAGIYIPGVSTNVSPNIGVK
jgi:hypothetical protein